MADFGVNATQLSDAQGQGTNPLAPVQEKVSMLGMAPAFGEVVNIFAKGLKDNAKEAAEARKNAIVGEYINNEKVYGDALTSGQWGSSQVSIASRANFTKMIASHPEYVEELTKARNSVYGGTEVGEAQKKVEAEQKIKEADIQNASNMGYTFYPGMSDDAKNKTIDAYKSARRIEYQFDQDTKRAAETRAQNSEVRSAGSYQMSVDDHVAKENAVAGAREIAAKNFDTVSATADDLFAQVAKGMAPEQALAIHGANINRIKAGLIAIAGKNPDMAAPWVKLFDEIDTNVKERLDPKTKSADELKLLQDKYNILITKSKLAAVEGNPRILKAVVASNLFQGEGMVTLANAPVVKEWLLAGSGVDPTLPPPPQMVGKDDAELFNITKTSLNRLQSGKIPVDQKEKATIEAVNVVNTLLKQTTTADGAMNPRALKEASKFFASPEFGKLSFEGKVDKQTAANAQHVFQVQYEPAVRQAIMSKLDSEVYDDEPLSRSVAIKTVGGNVVFERKSAGTVEGGFLARGMRGNDITAGRAALKDAEAGLNQLIRLHAHLEGTTDYAKYWETNKHQLMPSIYPDPAKLKPGQVVDGHKYIGGNYRDRSNWIAEPKPTSK